MSTAIENNVSTIVIGLALQRTSLPTREAGHKPEWPGRVFI
jgi:hypothetical protein